MAVLHASAQVDRKLSGRARWIVIVVVSSLAATVPAFDQPPGWPTWAAIVAFVLMWLVFLFALVDRFRADAADALKDIGASVLDWFVLLCGARWPQRTVQVSKLPLVAGLVAAGLANVLTIADEPDGAASVSSFAWGTLGVGLALAILGALLVRKAAKTGGLVMDRENSSAARAAVAILPAVIDCRNGRDVEAAAAVSPHPLVVHLLQGLATWETHGARTERDYQRRLMRRLKELFPDANPRQEKYFGDQERADILLGDDDGGILIEMKCSPTTSEIDRLYGQAIRYSGVWANRGPILLVLCKTPTSVTPRLAQLVTLLRDHGNSAIAILTAA
jgi:hypothetical protein